jgi:structural maintenance of chromosomes protein 6
VFLHLSHIVSNIQVENPVAVLDQEEAKKFLMGKAEDKYNFFMKATELERVDQSYATTQDNVIEMSEANNRAREGLQQKCDQVATLKKKYEEHLEIDKIQAKLQQMKVKYAWSYYHNADKDYKKCLEVSLTIEISLFFSSFCS